MKFNNINVFFFLTFIGLIILTNKIKTNEIRKSYNSNTEINLINLNQYLYYFPQKQLILCSDKIFKNSDINLIPNELKLKENEFTCMINLNNNYENNKNKNKNIYLKVNLHIMKPLFNNSEKDSIDIYLGDSLLFKNLFFFSKKNEEKKNFYTKNLLVKINNNKEVFFLKEKEELINNSTNNNNNDINCELNNNYDKNCNFQTAYDSLFKNTHLMLNLKLKEYNIDFVSFIQENNNKNKTSKKI
jgi:hypothetical protein